MSDLDTNASGLRPGVSIDGRYEIVAKVGQGGFATVYQARQAHIDRMVALKFLHIPQGLSSDKTGAFEERFVREAKIAARIAHPNVVTIHDFGFWGAARQPFIAMELLEGHDLETEMQRHGPLTPARALPLFGGVLAALGEGHALGIVHKDIKPSNLFLCHPHTAKESLRIVDFGIARYERHHEVRLTDSGQMLGTPQYLAPEYIAEQRVSPAIDVYQMALVLVEALTGEPVVQCDNAFQCVLHHSQGRLAIPDALRNGALGPLLRHCTQRDPAARVPNGSEFATRLAAVDAQRVWCTESIAASPTTLGEEATEDLAALDVEHPVRQSLPSAAVADQGPAPEASPRLQRVLTLLSVAVLLGGALLAWLWWRQAPTTSVPVLAGSSAATSVVAPPVAEPGAPAAAEMGAAASEALAGVLRRAAAAGVSKVRAGAAPALAAVPELPEEGNDPNGKADPALVWVEVLSEPEGARIYRDGDAIGTTPARIAMAAESEVALELRLRNYGTRTERFVARDGLRVGGKLQPRKRSDDRQDAPGTAFEGKPQEDKPLLIVQ